MTKFDIPSWEPNVIADNACKDVFKIKSKASKRNELRKAKKKKSTPIKQEALEKEVKLEKKKSLHNKNPTPNSSPKKAKKKKHIVEKVRTSLESNPTIKKNKKKKKQKITENTNEEIDKLPVQNETKCDVKPEHKSLLEKSNTKESMRLKRVKEKLKVTLEGKSSKVKWQELPLRERMLEKLKAARFRYFNEEIYTKNSKDAVALFQNDPESFKAYHEGYRQQVSRWPLNPLDNIIKSIKKMPQNIQIADFGCGEARLAQSVPQKVHSFDIVASNENVIACDMSKVPLEKESVDIVVFCLSLMGTNLIDYLFEANRVLKVGGTLKIAEVESRFDTLESFVAGVERVGFKNVWKDLSHNLFYFLDFKKELHIKKKNKLPTISLHPCLYKRR